MPEIKIISVSHEQPSETENFVNVLYSYSKVYLVVLSNYK